MDTACSTTTQFALESLEQVFDEVSPLLVGHYTEIEGHLGIPLDIDWEAYAEVEKAGAIRIFTARIDGNLIGYTVFFVHTSLHYKTSKQAVQDGLFIDPEHRGFGMKFLRWCDTQLRNEGVQFVHHSVSVLKDFGQMLERLGYEKSETVYRRRLG